MINYSVVKRKNLAKPDEAPKTYATAQCDRVMELQEFAEHIASHNSKYNEADIMAVVIMAVKCLKECILDGKLVRFGKLGDFFVSLASRGEEDGSKFSSENITACTLMLTPGHDFETLLAEAEFRAVATRAVQSAMVKAEKSGVNTVNLDEVKKKTAANGAGGQDPDGGGGGSQGGGSQTGGDPQGDASTGGQEDDDVLG